MNLERTPRLRFSIGLLFAATAFIGIVLAYNVNWMRERARVRRDPRVEEFQFLGTGKSPPGMLGLFGDYGNQYLIVRDPKRGEIEYLGRLFPEAKVSEAGSRLPD
jgi:hypothetical protein